MDLFDAARTVPIEEWARNDVGMALHPSGHDWRGCCPICGGNNATKCKLFTATNSFYCFGCGAGGDVINFALLTDEKLKDRTEAAKVLCGAYMIPYETPKLKSAGDRQRETERRQKEYAEVNQALLSAARGFRAKADLANEDAVAEKLRDNADMAEAAAGFEYTETDPMSAINTKLTTLRLIGEVETANQIETDAGDAPTNDPIKIPDEDPWDDEEPDPPRFVWYPFLPHGKLTVVSARGGAGKGMFACLIAAKISSGFDFGELESERYDFHALEGPAHTVYFSRGEDPAKIIRKRYRDSGGMKGYFHTFTEANKDFDISKLKLDDEEQFLVFRGIVRKFNAKFVIFDTIDKFLNANENKKDEVQDALTKIQAFADAEDISILCITHDRKGGSGGNMADRVAGSREWTDVPRSVLHIDFDPEDPNAEGNRRDTNRRVVVPSKNNLAAWGSLNSIRFIIDGPKGAGYGRFPVSDDGCTFEASVTADDFELADLRKTTVRAVIMDKKKSSLTAEARSKLLRDAIQSEVSEMRRDGQARRRYSYGEFETKHGGKSVWGGELQKVKALEFVSSDFKENGIFISTRGDNDKPIRGRDGQAGFEITVTNP